MAFVPFKGFGKYGVVHDSPDEALPLGVWSNARNIRFSGIQMEKMLEPTIAALWDTETNGDPLWLQGWADGLSTYWAVATANRIFVLRRSGQNSVGEWQDVTRASGQYLFGQWQSFAWGNTVIFNNGRDVPQIFNQDTFRFEDLPKWGLISSVDDLTNNAAPTRQVEATCTHLYPLKSFLVASGVTENGLYQPNKIWWSDATALATFKDVGDKQGPPSWDYESPSTLSAQSEIAPESGAIRTAELLNDNLIIYTDAAATALSVVGGANVMASRRLFNKGAASLHSVCEFNNQHFCVSQDQIYIHDGSTVKLIAKDRVEEEFFTRIGKGGRFGDGQVEWALLQAVKNPDRKEIIITYGALGEDIPVNVPDNYSIATGAVQALPATASGTVVVPGDICKEYECDAVEQQLLSMSSELISAWPMLVDPVRGDTTALQNDLISTNTLTCPGSQVIDLIPNTDPTPCNALQCMKGFSNSSNSGSAWQDRNVDVWTFDVKNNHTVGGHVRRTSDSLSNTLLPIAEFGNRVTWWIDTVTGNVKITYRGQVSDSYTIDFGDVFPLDFDWHYINCRFQSSDVGGAGCTASIQIDNNTYNGSNPVPAGWNEAHASDIVCILHSSQAGGATPGLDSFYMYVAEGGVSGQQGLIDAFSQNYSNYVDPDPNCQPVCKEYECDAFTNALNATVDSHWLFEDGVTAGQGETDVLGFMNFPAIGTGAKGSPIMQDECTVTGSTRLGTGVMDNTSPPVGLTREGGAGLFASAAIAQELTLFKISYGSICDINLSVVGGAKIGLSLAGFPSHTFAGIASADTYIWFNWNLVEATANNWELEVEMFYDFVSQGTITLSSADTRGVDINVTAFQMGFGGTGEWFVQHAAYSQTRLTAEQIATLKSARDQNRADYVDPNPNCIQPVCKEYDCDSLRKVITETNSVSYYPMRDGYTELSINSGNVVSGDELYDVNNVNNLEFIVGGGNVLLPEAPALLDNCSGTAFNANSLTSRSTTTSFTPTGKGSFVAVWDSSSTSGSFGIDAAENQHIYINNGDVQATPPGGPLQTFTIPKIPIPNAPQTAYLFIVTWEVVLDNTILNVYNHTGLPVLEDVEITGKVFDAGSIPPTFVQIGWLATTWQDCALYDRVLSDQEVQRLAAASLQNLTGYVDPNPNCQTAGQAQITKTPRRKDDPPTIQIPRRPGRDII